MILCIFKIVPVDKGTYLTGCSVYICLPTLSHKLAIRHDLEGLPPNFHIFGDLFMDDAFKFIYRRIRYFAFYCSHNLFLTWKYTKKLKKNTYVCQEESPYEAYS
jgi:hypothetical protein